MSALRISNLLSLLRTLLVSLLPQREPAVALEKQIARLKAEVAVLKSQDAGATPWWNSVAGTFKNDAMFNEAMSLGAEYRCSDEQLSEALES